MCQAGWPEGFFLQKESSLARGSHETFEKRERKRRVRRVGMERAETEQPNVWKVETGKERCGSRDVVDCV